MKPSSGRASKLPQEAEIVAGEGADVVDAGAHHHQPLDAEAEGEAAVDVRVVADARAARSGGPCRRRPSPASRCPCRRGSRCRRRSRSRPRNRHPARRTGRSRSGTGCAAPARRAGAPSPARTPFRSAIVMCCGRRPALRAGGTSTRGRRPGPRSGRRGRARPRAPAAPCCSMTRACIGEVWVRSTISPGEIDDGWCPRHRAPGGRSGC